jgi:hypothetical protein
MERILTAEEMVKLAQEYRELELYTIKMAMSYSQTLPFHSGRESIPRSFDSGMVMILFRKTGLECLAMQSKRC